MEKYITNIQLQDDILSGSAGRRSFKNIKQDVSSAYVAGKTALTLEDDVTLQDVIDAVLRASSKTGRAYSFFVVRHKKVA